MPLLSDWNAEATRGFGISFEPREMADVPMRASFLIEDGETVVATWVHGAELPDLDAAIEAARSAQGR